MRGKLYGFVADVDGKVFENWWTFQKAHTEVKAKKEDYDPALPNAMNYSSNQSFNHH